MGETKEIKKHFSKLGLMFLLGAIVINLVQIVGQLLVQRLKPELLENPNGVMFFSMIVIYGIGMPALILFLKRVPATTIEKKPMKVWQFLVAIVMCFCVMYCSNIVGLVITGIIGLIKGSMVNNVLMEFVGGTNILLTFLYTVICAPIMEEYVCRKLIVDRTVRYGQGVAVVTSGLMFGLFHGNMNQFVYAFTLGMFLAFLYVKTGKLRYTIGIHMIINFFGGVFSTVLMDSMNYNEYLAAFEAGASPEELMNILMAALPAWLIFMAYGMLVFGVIIGGIVLFIVFRKRFTFAKGEVQIPKGKRFATVILNVGMLLYCAFWMVEIVLQLFDTSIATSIMQKLIG